MREVAARPEIGLIPAHAGKIRGAEGQVRRQGAHPRSRGENRRDRPPMESAPGSSPLTRGKSGHGRDNGRRAGLIPAHAGKIQTAAATPCSRRAHPRSRGENMNVTCATWQGRGSSPLTRGKCRSTPRPKSCPVAHPRSRGENSLMRASAAVVVGSSPLTRGKLTDAGCGLVGVRLIPAHAGKIRLHYASRPVYRAHPRSRGENTARTGRRRAVRGSSPLTRGK